MNKMFRRVLKQLENCEVVREEMEGTAVEVPLDLFINVIGLLRFLIRMG